MKRGMRDVHTRRIPLGSGPIRRMARVTRCACRRIFVRSRTWAGIIRSCMVVRTPSPRAWVSWIGMSAKWSCPLVCLTLLKLPLFLLSHVVGWMIRATRLSSRKSAFSSLALAMLKFTILALTFHTFALGHVSLLFVIRHSNRALGVVFLRWPYFFSPAIPIAGRASVHVRMPRRRSARVSLRLAARTWRHRTARQARMFSCLLCSSQRWTSRRVGLGSSVTLQFGCRRKRSLGRACNVRSRVAIVVHPVSIGRMRPSKAKVTGSVMHPR